MLKNLKTSGTFIAILMIFLSNIAFASPQRPDFLIYKGDTIPTYNLILEEYYKKINEPDNGSLFGLKFRDGSTLNCWRGYQAIYEIENDSLFLKHIINCGARKVDQSASDKKIKKIFGNKVKNGKVFLNWYTGKFSIPNGKLLRWDGVFYKIFENEILFKVKKGIIHKISKIVNYIDNPRRINRRYKDLDTITKIFINELSKQNWNNKKEIDCSDKYRITISKKGSVKRVIMPEYKTQKEINEFWDKGEYKYCIRKVHKALKNLKFDIIKKKGKPIEENYYIEFFIKDNGKIENWTNL